MSLTRTLTATAGRTIAGTAAALSGRAIAAVAAVGASAAIMLACAGAAQAATPSATPSATQAATQAAPALTFGTLDTQPGTAGAESSAGLQNAMFEFNWASFEPERGVFDASYLATMQSYLAAYQAAHLNVTLGLGLQNPPSWVFSLPNSTYVNQYGATSTEADFVFSQAVRQAAAGYLNQIAADFPLSSFWAIRLTSGGDGEMLYPPGGTYWAFDNAALTGVGLAIGMTPDPYPAWRPGQPGLTPAQVATWVNWYIGGLDSVTAWQMSNLKRLGFNGYYETVTPGSGSLPDYLAATEQQDLPAADTTAVGAVWNLYYAKLPVKTSVIAYISSVADESGGNDTCQPGDNAIPLTSPVIDSWSATRWITRIANQNHLLVGGENPGYGIPAALNSFYTDTSQAGMMTTAISQARSCGFTVFYWAHDVHLWDGTVPLSDYTATISSTASLPGANA